MEVKLDTYKVIGDPVHGYIRITPLEYDLLQLPIMNRLHYIHQTATAQLTFPGSVTTRFSHVIGAMYLGGKIISHLLTTINEIDFRELFPGIEKPDFVVKSIRLACLFHDIGHGPFSHSSEEAMLKIMQKHPKEIEEASKLFETKVEKDIPIHEYFSYKIISTGEIKEEIEKQESLQLVKSISELLIKTKNSEIVKQNPIGYPHLRKIVSGQLDADRMDYLLRDSLMSGVKFGMVDVHRIIDNMALVRDSSKVFHIAFHERALGSIEDMLDARFKMYKWFYNHHTVMTTNRLMEIAIDLMIEDDPSIGELFHWSSYSKGKSIDEYILLKLREFIETKKERYSNVKGLIDRRYMPASLFKRTPDYRRLTDKINQKIGVDQLKASIMKMITTFFKGDGESKLKKRISELDDDLKTCVIFQSSLERKTYKPFLQNTDKVFLYRKPNTRFCELLSESEYFQHINNEWIKFPNVYVSFLIPGKTKKEFEKHSDRLIDIIAEEVAKLSEN